MMKKISLLLVLLSQFGFTQIDCEYNTNVKDSIGTYKSTNGYLAHQKLFGNSNEYLFFSLVKADETPFLNIQIIEKNTEFIKAHCLDENSKIYFQLDNGKLVTLLHIDKGDCGSQLKDETGKNSRITTGYFLFMKDSYEELKNAPISLMRIKFATETVDYIIRKEVKSEIDSKIYTPNQYFMNYLKCIE